MLNKSEVACKLSEASDGYILEMRQAVEKAFKHDASLTDELKATFQQFNQDGLYYGTDIYTDWVEWRAMLRQEAAHRGL